MPLQLRSALARANDASSVAHGAVSTAAIAGLTLIEPRSLSVRGRLAYRAAAAGVTAWTTWASFQEEPVELPLATRIGLTVGAAGAALGIAEAGEAIDARVHDRLLAAGVGRPRAVLAAGAAVAALGTWWLARRSTLEAAAAGGHGDAGVEPTETLVEVPAEVRALAERLLGATDDFGAATLRAQLADARASVWEGPEPDAFWPGIGFAVPAVAPLAVPGDASFPVIGRYRPLEGRSFDVALAVQEGRLAVLSIAEGRDWSEEERVAWMEADRGVHELTAWPKPDELELLIETPEGLRPIG
ncbi:hypothetical protein [Agrococcus sp. Marseille-P2731]|uniref:hypothetical protein n=1 Tax=Agrococcus sp. Marseille-P2731 TaxID=1841862 RepID=UPI0009301E20|nr:hypothetical protein [Agrococcus sp. Marseille-P2731]